MLLFETHTRIHTPERERERERSPLDAEGEKVKKKEREKNCFFHKKRRKKRVSFAVKTFVVELNIWMPQAK